MGIFSKIRQAFGFGSNEFDEDEDNFADATVQPRSRDNDIPGDDFKGNHVLESIDADDTGNLNDSIPAVPLDSIFNTVVNEFNKAMPSFIGSGANADMQRRHLYDALDADVKQLLASLQENAVERCNCRWERERSSLNSELSSVRDRLKSMEDSYADKGKQLLSAERQKRALTERIHDLESQVAGLEAERDQYELETRSLVNKLRVSNMVNEGAEIPDVTTYETRISELQQQLDALHGEQKSLSTLNDQLTSQNSEVISRNTALEASNRDLREQLEALKLKTDMTDVMLNDLNTRASSSAKEVQQRDDEIESLREQLKDAIQQAEATQSQLDEARANLEIAASVQDEVERIQEAINKKNGQISELTLEVRRRDDRINALEAEENSLRKTIETNLLVQAENEKSLREDIARMQQQLTASSTKDRLRAKRKPTMKISAIDEDLDNTDWLVATPPEGTSARTSGVSDAEFGYQEPQRKNPPENSAQMSLW